MPSLYDISVPPMKRTVRSALHILKLGEEWAAEQETPRSEIPGWRLHENMLPLSAQVILVTVQAKLLVANLTGGERPTVTLPELSLDGLYTLLDETIALLDSVDSAEKVTADESTVLSLRAGPRQVRIALLDSVLSYTIPHSYFHLVTLYDILRMKGVPLGKSEYMLSHFKEVAID
ncbi:hypothetical protein SLS62_003695 [Diatrype stigma]|uniref:Uncharacterized protein n=1 Tax=Diatrype stigma TaxID=117547 RepID=A0AAN9UWA4_9PEZI